MKQFTGETRFKIDLTQSTLHTWKGKQRSQTSNQKEENENEFSFDNYFQNVKPSKYPRSLSSDQKPIYPRIVFQNKIRKHMLQEGKGDGKGSQIPKGNTQAKENQEKAQSLHDQRSQKSVGHSEQDYQNHIKPIEEQFKEKFLPEFIEDSLQLESLFYQLAQNNFIRTPITSSPPIIVYYIFCLLVGYRHQDPYYVSEQLNKAFSDFKNLQKIIRTGTQSLPLKLLFVSVEGNDNLDLPQQFIYYCSEILKLLNKQNFFNFRLALDDFEKYSELYFQNKVEIEKHLQYEIYKRQNVCIGFIRFLFIHPGTDIRFNIRIPLGEFQSENIFSFKDIRGENSFSRAPWYECPQGGHSEKILLAWMVLNEDILVKRISDEIIRLCSDLFQVYLEKIFWEVTSERRVCNKCVDMFSLFPFMDFFIGIMQKVNKKIKKEIITIIDQFQLIVVTQYLCESQNKESGSDNQSSFSSLSQVSRQRRLALPQDIDHKNFIYFEIGQVGMMTEKYLEHRYSNKIINTQISSPIDQILLKNTIFISSEAAEQISMQKPKQSLKLQGLISIYDQFKENVQRICKKQLKIEQPQLFQAPKQLSSLEQNQIQQIYSLLWLLIQNLQPQLMPIEVDIFHLRLLMFQYLKIPDLMLSATLQYLFLIQRNVLYEKGDQKKAVQTLNELLIQNIFYSVLNIPLFIKDYLYINKCIRNQPQFNTKERDMDQLFTNHNIQYNNILGIIQVFAVLNSKGQTEKRIEIQLNIEQLNMIATQLIDQLKKIQHQGFVMHKIQLLISTIQQLSINQKEYLNSVFSLQDFDIYKEYHYTYFRKLQANQEQLANERQYTIYDLNIFQARYLLQNKGTQTSLFDIDELINKQKIIIRGDEEIRELQQK